GGGAGWGWGVAIGTAPTCASGSGVGSATGWNSSVGVAGTDGWKVGWRRGVKFSRGAVRVTTRGWGLWVGVLVTDVEYVCVGGCVAGGDVWGGDVCGGDVAGGHIGSLGITLQLA